MAKLTNDDRYFALIQKTINSQKLTNEELNFFVKHLPEYDDARMQDLLAKRDLVGADGRKLELTGDEVAELLTEQGKQAMASPSAREMYLGKAEEIAKSDLGSKIANVLTTAIAAGDIVASSKQISEARRLARQSRRPNKPAPLTQDPMLQQAIVEAQQGTFDTARRLAPAQLEILNNYLSDLNNAKTASTGQAGTYGALAQVASSRRNRGALELAPIADSIRAREQARLDNLLQMRLGENQAIQQSQAQNYGTDVYSYMREQQAIGELGAAGRQNLRQSVANFGQQVPGIASGIATKRRFDKIRALMNPYGQDVADLAVQVETDANQNANNRFKPNYGQMTEDERLAELDQMYPYAPR